MMKNPDRESATIYQFPVRGRFAAAVQREDAATNVPNVVFGEGWYHDEAIRDAAELARRN